MQCCRNILVALWLLAFALPLPVQSQETEPSLGQPVPVDTPDADSETVTFEPPVVDFTTPQTATGRRSLARVGLQHLTGDGAGYRESYTSFEAFVPLLEQPAESLWFGDLRLLLSNDAAMGLNAGVGRRWFAERHDRIFGVQGFFDMRDTSSRRFSQIGGTLETLGAWWDFRTNFYFPVGTSNKIVQETADFSNIFFFQHQIVYDRVRAHEIALGGFDLEFGVPLLRRGMLSFWGFAGLYHFQGTGSRQAYGSMGRLETRLTRKLYASLSITNDPLFDTNVNMGVAFYFPRVGPRRVRFEDETVPDRLDDPIRRRFHIAVARKSVRDPIPLTDPVTLQPIMVRHVNNLAAPGGDGTAENPFNMLADVEATSMFRDIIFVRRGDGTNQGLTGGITLKDGQRLLGDGFPHQFVAIEGTFALPEFSIGPYPRITGPVVAVTLANDNEVAAFNIENTPSSAIFSLASNGFNIHHNNITGAGLDSINIQNASGTGFIGQNNLINHARDGVRIGTAPGNTLDLTLTSTSITAGGTSETAINLMTPDNATTIASVTNNTIVGHANSGLHATGPVDLTFDNNRVTGAGLDAIFLENTVGSTTIANNVLTGYGRDGLRVFNSVPGTLAVAAESNVIAGNGVGVTGIHFNASGGAGVSFSATNNDITGHTDAGVHATGVSGLTVDGNRITGTGVDAIRLLNATGNATITANTLDDYGRDGVQIINNMPGVLAAQVANNSIDGNGAARTGVLVDASGGSTVTPSIVMNTITNHADAGIAATAVSGLNIDRNAITGAGVDGIRLINTTGTAILSSNMLSGYSGDGLQVVNSNGSTLNLTAASNTIVGGGMAINGINIDTSGGSNVTATLAANPNITGHMTAGVAVSAIGADTQLTVTATNNNVHSNGDGFTIDSRDTADLTGTFMGNTVLMNSDRGFDVRSIGTMAAMSVSDVNLTFDGNDIRSNGDDGLNLIAEGNVQFHTNVLNNMFTDNGAMAGMFDVQLLVQLSDTVGPPPFLGCLRLDGNTSNRAAPPAYMFQNSEIPVPQFFLDIGTNTGGEMAVGTFTLGPCP